MNATKRLLVGLTLAGTIATPIASAGAQLQYSASFDASGAGLGAVLTVLTLMSPRNTSVETGCITPAGKVAGGVMDPVCGFVNSTIQQQTQVRYLTEPGLSGLNGANLRVVSNFSEPQNDAARSAQIDNLVLFLYSGNTLVWSSAAAIPHYFAVTEPGVGNVGFLWGLTGADIAGFDAAMAANPSKLSIGLGAKVSSATGGLETFSIARDASVVTTPEPASLVLLGTGLVGIYGAVRRRRYTA